MTNSITIQVNVWYVSTKEIYNTVVMVIDKQTQQPELTFEVQTALENVKQSTQVFSKPKFDQWKAVLPFLLTNHLPWLATLEVICPIKHQVAITPPFMIALIGQAPALQPIKKLKKNKRLHLIKIMPYLDYRLTHLYHWIFDLILWNFFGYQATKY